MNISLSSGIGNVYNRYSLGRIAAAYLFPERIAKFLSTFRKGTRDRTILTHPLS